MKIGDLVRIKSDIGVWLHHHFELDKNGEILDSVHDEFIHEFLDVIGTVLETRSMVTRELEPRKFDGVRILTNFGTAGWILNRDCCEVIG